MKKNDIYCALIELLCSTCTVNAVTISKPSNTLDALMNRQFRVMFIVYTINFSIEAISLDSGLVFLVFELSFRLVQRLVQYQVTHIHVHVHIFNKAHVYELRNIWNTCT